MSGRTDDAFGDASPELRWSNDFDVGAVAENKALQLVVYHYFQ